MPGDDPTPLRERPHEGPAPLQGRGEMVGRYLLLEELGRGGMGAVFAAWDTELGRRVAVKLLLSPHAGEEQRLRLRREAQAMARLRHPNVATVHDVGTHRGGTFIAMELIDGGTLASWLKSPREPREVLRVVLEAGRGLAAAHAAGLVHRDFKPGNVLIASDGRVVVTDFGLARADGPAPASDGGATSTPLPASPESGKGALDPSTPRAETSSPASSPGSGRKPLSSGADARIDGRVALDERVTGAGAIVGTVGYMAPEQLLQRRDDARSDQFAFCVTLYRALYGRLPFDARRIVAYAEALRKGPAPPPADSPVPRWIWPILRRGMSFSPDDRHPSMDALLAALEDDPTLARRRRLLALGAVVLAALAVAAFAGKRRAGMRACAAEGDAVAQTWGAAVREQVIGQLAAARSKAGARMPEDAPARTAAVLDRYAASWRGVREQACVEALGGGPEIAGLTGRRAACLDRGREQLAALVEQLAQADEQSGPAALRAALALQRPEACASPSASEPPVPADAASRGRLAEIRKELSRAQALRLTGRPAEALASASRAVELSRAAGDARAETEALQAVAKLRWLIGDPRAAIDDAMAAMSAAERSGDDAAAGRSAAFIGRTLTNSLDRDKEAGRWIAVAEAKLARVGQNDELEGEVLEARGLDLELRSRLEDALRVYDRLLALRERVEGPVSEGARSALNSRAIALGSLGRYEEALALHRRAIQLGEQLYGPNDLDLAIDYNNASRVLFLMGRFDEAERASRRSYELRLVLGSSSPRLLWPISNLAGIAARTGRPERALELADQGIAIAEAHPGAAGAVLPGLLIVRGEALVTLGRFEPAAAACRSALERIEREAPMTPDQPVDEPLTCLGLAAAGQGRLDEGLAHLERAVTLVRRGDPTSLAFSRFALARALHTAGRDPERARKLAEQAQSDLREQPALAADAQEVERWLSAPFGLAAGGAGRP